MSMDDNTIRVVRAGGLLLIGDFGLNVLGSPRAIMQRQDGKMVLVELIGNPKAVNVPADALSWSPTDEALIANYRESVTGLVMAQTVPGANVVRMAGGRKQ